MYRRIRTWEQLGVAFEGRDRNQNVIMIIPSTTMNNLLETINPKPVQETHQKIMRRL
jgi:hypothetical protein